MGNTRQKIFASRGRFWFFEVRYCLKDVAVYYSCVYFTSHYKYETYYLLPFAVYQNPFQLDMPYKSLLGLVLLFLSTAHAQKPVSPSFNIIPLGVKGGSDESNLSCYMVAQANTGKYVCLDAGTIYAGLAKAVQNKVFKGNIGNIQKRYIKGYLLSHPHLDHVAGLIINSPDDTAKHIYGLPFCLDIVKDKYFTWKNWANFTNEGDKPTLNKYEYNYLNEGEETLIENTNLHVKAFTLSHANPYQSTAFLIRSNDSYILYLGDTGADEIEKSTRLNYLWRQVANLIVTKKLKSIFIEVSFRNQQPPQQLFGHLTPALLMKEMENLSRFTGKPALQNCKIIITHMKPAGNHEAEIKRQLQISNKLRLQFIFPVQGLPFAL